MGKFAYAVLTVFLVELALYLFAGTNYSTSSLFDLIMNPTNLASTVFYTLIYGVLIVFGASTIIPGNLFQINIYALFAGIGVAVITFSLSVVHLWQFIYGELSGIMPLDLSLVQVITVLIVTPFLIFYILSIAEWVRSNS